MKSFEPHPLSFYDPQIQAPYANEGLKNKACFYEIAFVRENNRAFLESLNLIVSKSHPSIPTRPYPWSRQGRGRGRAVPFLNEDQEREYQKFLKVDLIQSLEEGNEEIAIIRKIQYSIQFILRSLNSKKN